MLEQADRLFARARGRAAAAGILREVGNILGFGYLNYIIDLVTASDAEYRVDLI